jgi:hypothetical protein
MFDLVWSAAAVPMAAMTTKAAQMAALQNFSG